MIKLRTEQTIEKYSVIFVILALYRTIHNYKITYTNTKNVIGPTMWVILNVSDIKENSYIANKYLSFYTVYKKYWFFLIWALKSLDINCR